MILIFMEQRITMLSQCLNVLSILTVLSTSWKLKGAYWTLDVIVSYWPKFRSKEFVVIYFDVDKGKCKFYIQEDTNMPKFIKQSISFTDLDVSVKMYYTNGVLMFPSDN